MAAKLQGRAKTQLSSHIIIITCHIKRCHVNAKGEEILLSYANEI